MSWKIKFTDGARFMASSLSNLDNLTEIIHEIKCKDCDCFLEYESVKNNFKNIDVYLAIKITEASLMKN